MLYSTSSKQVQRSLRKRCFASIKETEYVILGAGSAGCVLANRLSAAGKSVTIIEAGGPDRGTWDWWKSSMPAALTYNLSNTKYNWDYSTVPQKHMDGRKLHQPRGKMLGGSSSINAMVYIRGHPKDYDDWAIEGWSYRDVLPYFKKAQSHELGANDFRGGSGPLQVCQKRTKEAQEINDAFVQAGVNAGYGYTEDMNGYSQEGFGPMDMTVARNGTRATTAQMYLHPAQKKNPDLVKILTHSHVNKILFDGNRAIGVEYTDKAGATQTVHAKEVILSLGAVGTPQTLMLSGVGNPADLKEHGIDVKLANDQVGANLQDHLEYYVQYLCKKPVTLYPYAATYPGFGELSRYLYRNPFKAAGAGLQWMLTGTGLASSNHFEVGGFLRTQAGLMQPNIQYHFIPGCVVGQLDFLPHHGYQAHCGTMRPTSYGSIKLSNADPRAAPLIDPNFLATENDVVEMRDGLRRTLEIMEGETMAPYREARLQPAPSVNVESDAEVDRWIRQFSHSAYHLSCTAAMGKVVDNEGKVMGLDNLRVADASIMPFCVSGNLNAPTIMIAEKIADAILGQSLPAEDIDYFKPDPTTQRREPKH